MPAKPKFNLDEVAKKFTAIKPKLMTDLEAISTTFFINSWRIQGWDNGQVEKWKEVQRRTPGTAAYKSAKKSSRTRAILVKSGTLRRGFKTRIKRMDMLQIINSVPYAKFHNEGELRIPQRQFMGHSPTLGRMQQKSINKHIKMCFK